MFLISNSVLVYLKQSVSKSIAKKMLGGVQVSVVAALVILCGSAAPGAASVNMGNVCLLVPQGTLVASDSDCSSYYLCQGSKYTLMACNNGMHFDKDQQGCVSSQLSACATAADPCYGTAIGKWASVPGSCGGYYYCSTLGPLRGNCPYGEIFDNSVQQCLYQNSTNQCSETVVSGTGDSAETVITSFNLCSIIQNNQYFGNPTTCQGWNMCSNNRRLEGLCPTGFVFDVSKRMCDYNTMCVQVTNDASLLGNSTPGVPVNSLAGQACTVGTNATACNQYYTCTNSKYVLATCAAGLFYDTVTSTCVASIDARNDCDRCIGTTTATFINAYSKTSCANYLVCSNGVSVGSESCPTNFYFNQVRGGCSDSAEPSYGCCNPSFYATATTATTVTTPAPTTQKTAK